MADDGYSNPTHLPSAPYGWGTAAIEELCEKVTSGATPLRSTSTFYEGGVHSWFKTQELKDSALSDAEEKITDEALAQTSAKLFPKDTVLMAMYGDGKTITSLGILSNVAATNQACCAMIPNRSRCEPRFLFYALKYHRSDFLRIASGGAQRNLSGKLIRRFAINTPPLNEQRAIAQILGTLDEKIELNRRMNETLEALARALFKSWFVDFNPVRAKSDGRDPGLPETLAHLFPDAFEDSELGEIPRGWGVKSLDAIAQFLNGLALQRYPPKDDRSLPVIKIAQLRAGNTNGADRASIDLDPAYVVNDGDILFSWSGSLECVLWAAGSGALNQHLFKVTSVEFPQWLCYLGVHTHLDNFRHIAAGKATTMGHIQRHHLSDAKLAVPPKFLLDEMNSVFGPIIESLWRRDVQSRSLATVRDALLPKLISGEVRLKGAETSFGRLG